MIESLLIAASRGLLYIKHHPQLLMTVVIVITVPIAFLINGQQFLNASRDNQESLEKNRVGIIHDLLGSVITSAQFESTIIQKEIELLASRNPDITKIRVLREEGTNVRIIASLDAELVQTFATDANTYRISNANPDEAIIIPYAHNGTRYWQSFSLVRDDQNRDYFIFIESSLEHIDALFSQRIMVAYYWLVGLLAVIVMLLVRHVRLIDYAYLYRETKKTNELKDLFTNMIAHELRAPLTAMRGYASLIRENVLLDEAVRTQAKRIEDSASRLVLVVSDLLDVARIQSGKLSVVSEELAINSVILSVIDGISVSAREKSIIIEHEGLDETIMILGDEKRLFQALTNIVSNAIKYTKRGSITVSLEDRVDRIEIRVKDTGMGISADNQKNLFAPFFRVESADMSTIIGTGLGMWITKQLIELMSGSISIESIKGVGTHVILTLPKKLVKQ